MKNLKRFFKEEEGMGTVEIILIIVILIALVLIFKENIIAVVEKIVGQIDEDTDKVLGR